MAEKGFGVKEINLIGASGTPTIESPNNLNLNAVNVAISTNVSIGGTLTVSGNVSVGGTLTYEDVTNIDSIGIITARSVIHAGAGLTVTGITTFRSDVNFGDYLGGNGAPIITFDESDDLLWFKKQTAGGSSAKIGLGGGGSYDHLQLQQTYTGGGQSEITAFNSNILIACNNTGKSITIQSQNDLTLLNSVYPFIKGEKNSGSDQSVTLYYGQTGSTPYANPKLETTSTGINVTGAITVNGSALSITPTATDVQVAYELINTSSGGNGWRINGNGIVNTTGNPDLYLIRGQKYRFINNSGGSHPFRIQSDSSTAYDTGVTNNNSNSGNIDFVPRNDAPARLYYNCTNHGGMLGNIYLRGAGGQTTNVGVTTFSGFVNVNGNFGIGNNSTPDGNLHVFNSSAGSVTADTSANLAVFESGNTNNGITILSPNTGKSNIYFGTTGTGGSYEAGIRYTHEAHGTNADRRAMHFRVGGGERARIQSGRLLVGRTNNITIGGNASDHCFEQITNDGYTLTAHSDLTNQRGLGIYYTSGKTPEAAIGFQVGSAFKFIVLGSGNVVNANDSYGQISDISLKENIVDANSQWDDIKNLKIRNFNFKSSTGYDTHTQIGLVAQEVETVCPKLVGINEDGTKNVTTSVLYMKAVKCLQEAMIKIEILEAEVAALKAK